MMTIKKAYVKAFRCMNFASFIHQSAEAVSNNTSAISIMDYSFGLSSIAEKMTEDLADVADFLREEAEPGKEATDG